MQIVVLHRAFATETVVEGKDSNNKMENVVGHIHHHAEYHAVADEAEDGNKRIDDAEYFEIRLCCTEAACAEQCNKTG